MNYRKEKRAMRKMGMLCPVYAAWNEGQATAWFSPMPWRFRAGRNPYPPGRRHDEFERGKAAAGDMAETPWSRRHA